MIVEGVVVIVVVVGFGRDVVKIGSNVVVSLAVEVDGIDDVDEAVVYKNVVVVREVVKTPTVDVVSNGAVDVDVLVVNTSVVVV